MLTTIRRECSHDLSSNRGPRKKGFSNLLLFCADISWQCWIIKQDVPLPLWASLWKNLSSEFLTRSDTYRPGITANEACWRLEIQDFESRKIIQSKQGKTKTLISLLSITAELHHYFSQLQNSRFSHEAASIRCQISHLGLKHPWTLGWFLLPCSR